MAKYKANGRFGKLIFFQNLEIQTLEVAQLDGFFWGENFNKFCFIFFYLTVKLLKEIN